MNKRFPPDATNCRITPVKKPTGYFVGLRVACILGALVLWGVSYKFSVSGFSVESPDNLWVGYFLGLVATLLELVWNRTEARRVPTLLLAGILAYVYSVYTNVVGWQSVTDSGLIFSVLIGLFLDIVPEPLLLYGIYGASSAAAGDFISSLLPKHQQHPTPRPVPRPVQRDREGNYFRGHYDPSRLAQRRPKG